MDLEIYAMGTGSMSVLEGYVENNNYAMFHIHGYLRCRENSNTKSMDRGI